MFDRIREDDPDANLFPLLRSGPIDSLPEALVVVFAAVGLFLLLLLRARPSLSLAPLAGAASVLGIATAAGAIVWGIARIARRHDERGLFATGVVLFSLANYVRSTDADGLGRFLPILPAAIVLWAFVRIVRGADELQRRIVDQALAFAYVVVFIAVLGYSLLEKLGLPRSGASVWFLALFVSFWVGLALAARRYRD